MRNHLKQYAIGHGIEIGAYHNPFPLNAGVTVDYLDHKSYDELIVYRDNDPHLPRDIAISPVDIVDSGQLLSKVPNSKYDFLVSSHQLEHCTSPITAIENHLRVVKTGAHLIYFIPDKRFTFDKARDVTPLAHILEHYYEDSEALIMSDYHDYLYHVDNLKDIEKREAAARQYLKEGRDVHFHTWDLDSTVNMFVKCSEMGFKFTGILTKNVGHENAIVIKKTGEK